MVLNLKHSVKVVGLTLLETMLALAVGAILLIGATIFYQSSVRMGKVHQTMTDINNIRSAYKAYYSAGNTLSTAAAEQANQLLDIQNAGFLPNPMNDAWGQAYVVSLAWYSGYITIAIPGLGLSSDDKNCKAIWTMVQNSGGFSTSYGRVDNYQCAFRYRFP